MNKEQAIEKIKKCLALAKDSASEANEVSVALKQAQSLMKKYNVSEMDCEAADFKERPVNRNRKAAKLKQYEWWVLHVVKKVFGVTYYKYRDSVYLFGNANRLDIAQYAFDVLINTLKIERRKFLKTLSNKSNYLKTKKADEFCLVWIFAVEEKVQDFVMEEKEKEALELILKQRGAVATNSKIKTSVSADAYSAAMKAAEGFNLHHAATYKNDEVKALGNV